MTRLLTFRCVLCICLLDPSAMTLAQSPETAPTTRPRRVAEPPPGFARIEVEGRAFFVEPPDEQWVAQAVQRADPPTLPTTMPGDLIERLQQNRAELVRRISADLALEDAKEIDAYLDERLLPVLKRIEELRPPLIYVVGTPERLKEAVKAGWGAPDFYYNRAADDVEYSTTLSLSLDPNDDDEVRPVLYAQESAIEQRQDAIIKMMHSMESGILEEVSNRSQELTVGAMAEIVSEKGIEPLNLSEDQRWFGLGATGVLGARYAAEITGLDRERLLDLMARTSARNPVRPASIDLVNPTPVEDLRPEWVQAYNAALRARSIEAARKLVELGGDDAIGKTIAAIRQNKPADGPALVALIREATGVDLSSELAPR